MDMFEVFEPTSEGPAERGQYWSRRRKQFMYQFTLLAAKRWMPEARSAIDIGCHVSPLIMHLNWIPQRFVNDLKPLPEWDAVEGVTFIEGPCQKIRPRDHVGERKFDLVVCNQVIEHIDDAQGFAHTLCELGNRVIVSTTYEIPKGQNPGHVQDPISLEKFEGWFPRKAKLILIERMGDPRFAAIVGVF